MNNKVVASWQENGMLYTVTATPVTELIPPAKIQPTSIGYPTEMISIFDYFCGKTPARGVGTLVFNRAKQTGAKMDSKEINNAKWTGKIMLYERGFLDVYFNSQKSTITEPVTIEEVEDEDLPF